MSAAAEQHAGRPTAGGGGRPPVWLIVAAFGSLYFFWGSTYLGIKWALTGFPPFFLAGTRFVIAGSIMYAFARFVWGGTGRAGGDSAGTPHAPRPSPGQWGNAAIVGGLLLVGGNGIVTFATQYIPSGLAALLVSMLPIWMVLLDRPRGADGLRVRRSWAELAGVLTGFAGVALLIGPKVYAALFPESGVAAGIEAGPGGALGQASAGWQAVGAGVVVCSSLLWAIGSLYGRRVQAAGRPWGGLPRSPLLMVGMQMLCGGAMLLALSAATGELGQLSAERAFASATPTLALAYLIVFGSIVGYTAYIWLMSVMPSSRVTTYSYVNPVIAVVLGWALGGETLGLRTLLAAAVIVGSVAVIVTGQGVRGRLVRAKAARRPAVGAGDEQGTEGLPGAAGVRR